MAQTKTRGRRGPTSGGSPCVVEDLGPIAGEARAEILRKTCASELQRGFDFSKPPLMRARLLRWGGQAAHLIWTYHHAITDGFTTAIFVDELSQIYRAQVSGETCSLAPAVPFSRYLRWHSRRSGQRDAPAHWRMRCADLEPCPGLDIDPLRPGAPRTETRSLSVSARDSAVLRDCARSARVSESVVWIAATSMALASCTGRPSPVLGITVSLRGPELDGASSIAGPLINTLPLRVPVLDEGSVATWIGELKTRCSELLTHADCPLTKVQAWAGLPGGVSAFACLLVYENHRGVVRKHASDEAASIERVSAVEASHYPLTLYVVPGACFRLRCVFDTRRIRARTARRFVERIRAHLGDLNSIILTRSQGDAV